MKKKILGGIVAAMGALCLSNAYAGCSAPPAQGNRSCTSCGNLQENPDRGLGLGFDYLVGNPDFDTYFRLHGTIRLNLLNPPQSSPGRLFYYVIVRDPSHRVTDTVAHSQLVNISINSGIRSVGLNASTNVNNLWSRAVSFGTDDLHVRLYDQNNRFIGEGYYPRNAPTNQAANAPYRVREFTTDQQYRVAECVSQDPRGEDGGNSNPGRGSGGGGGGRAGNGGGGSSPQSPGRSPGPGGGAGSSNCRMTEGPGRTGVECPR